METPIFGLGVKSSLLANSQGGGSLALQHAKLLLLCLAAAAITGGCRRTPA